LIIKTLDPYQDSLEMLDPYFFSSRILAHGVKKEPDTGLRILDPDPDPQH
jgi:hypothetical protein